MSTFHRVARERFGRRGGGVSLLLITAVALAGCNQAYQTGPLANVEKAKELRLAIAGEPGEEEIVTKLNATGLATIKGRIVLRPGDAIPARPPLKIGKDLAVCAAPGVDTKSQRLIINEKSRGIKNVLVFLRDADKIGWEGDVPAPPEAGPVAEDAANEKLFDQKQCEFLDHVFPVRLGNSVKIANSDPVGHNTNIRANKGTSFDQTIPSGKFVSYQPTAAEAMPIAVSCAIHPWMSAWMLPRDNGYFAVTDENGNFEIDNVPTGVPLQFQVWHEAAAASQGRLDADVPEVGWSAKTKGRMILGKDQLKNNETLIIKNAGEGDEATIQVPVSAFKT